MTTALVIAVTGANGYVGSLVVDALKENAKVLGLVRTPGSADQIRWSFGSDVDRIAQTLRAHGVTHMVHAAWDMKTNSEDELMKTCVAGSLGLLTACRQAGVKKRIFISTISAFEGARSSYGRSKLIVEDLFRQAQGVVLRLGLVYGNRSSGTFGNLRNIVRTARIIPLIGDGTTPQYLLHERTLAEVVRRAVRGDFDREGNPLTLAQPEPIAFRDLLRHIARSEGRRVFLVPVPWRILYLALRSVEQLGLKLNVRSDSVLSFVHQNSAPDFGTMRLHSINPIQFSAHEFSKHLG
jgi:nucleoside-diphosphate-sugar epimerase